MKPIVLAVLAFFTLEPAVAQAPAAPDSAPPFRADGTTDGIQMARIADGIYVFTASADGYVDQTNSTAIVGRNGVLMFDTNTRPSTARAVLAMLRTVTDKPVRWIVNSHWHPDHWSGNEVYAEAFPGVEIIATERTARYMRNIAPAWPAAFAGSVRRLREAAPETDSTARAEQAAQVRRREHFAEEAAHVRRTYPTRTYRDRLVLDLGGRAVRLTDITGDASHSTMAWLPAERLLLTGDALVHPVSWSTNSFVIEPWMESLRAMVALEPRLVVPGHGALLHDAAYLRTVADFMAEVIRQVQAALLAGAVTVDDVQGRVDLGAFRARLADGDADYAEVFDAILPAYVRKVYQEQRDGMESRR